MDTRLYGNNFYIKVAVLGPNNAGKSCLIDRYDKVHIMKYNQ